MIKIDDKEFRNIEEQVEKNKNDIEFILQQEGVLNEFGIKVVGQEESTINLPTVADYKEDNENWEYGDTYAIGTEAPYELYVLTRANGTHPNDYWFNIGEFPMPGPQGEQGVQGEQGATGPQGPMGYSTYYVGQNLSTTLDDYTLVNKTADLLSIKVNDLVIGLNGILAKVISVLTANFTVQTLGSLKGAKGDPGDNLITVQVVENLPASGTPGILYFVANSSGQSQNAYDEYIYVNGQWEKLGQAQLDLSNYATKTYVDNAIVASINANY